MKVIKYLYSTLKELQFGIWTYLIVQFYMPEITENLIWTTVYEKTQVLTLMVPVALKLPPSDTLPSPDFSGPLGTQEQ